MQGDLLFPIPLLVGFLLVLTRIAGVFAFVPIPGAQTGPLAARVVLALCCTFALFPLWPVPAGVPPIRELVASVAIEAALGCAAGVLFSYIAEVLLMGAQVLSLQAGYAYASTIDPTTQADSGILMIFAQLTGGLLFFAAGLDRMVIAAFAASLESYPPGTFVATPSLAMQLIAAGAGVLSLACRLALPVVALLFMVDLSLGVLGRINAQLQAGALSFPLKMLLSLVMLALLLPAFTAIYENHAGRMLGTMRQVIAPR